MNMEFLPSVSPEVFTWVVVPLLIFVARILDVSIGTLRVIFVSKGYRLYAPILGFFEVVIWLLAIRQIMNHVDNVLCYLAYGLGFAVGNYIGIGLDERLSLGTVLVRIVPRYDTTELIDHLRRMGFGASLVDIEGMSGKLKMIFAIVKRKDLTALLAIIQEHNPQAFVTIEDVKTAKEGYFRPPQAKRAAPLSWLNALCNRK
ncbi:MAG TPA: DUF2179 domain-containing protein [Kiritimatiellia bacterium]|jgi:uncharacterized protein YebE (UPF0316 family)|nr:DUF2179 domain-containing protein [Kiritimatiellia bacterium]HOM59052.1 DUF2179 domain-containing protein [Kiritimatiellia bacterium]HOR98021.1 DUF2179 domain-containing protein [Kiritimatiellia bacterium]HPC49139.1 DUF2179 domain-containing protein [Kiritimatiellia bacterium]HPK37762.1 DUF2179 domain-containing protein [Kiritimatiellia bacterium]